MPSSENEEAEVLSKQNEPIQEGDHVYTKIRGGRHEGDVSCILTRIPKKIGWCKVVGCRFVLID
jgi:hypothetical protein